jgi:hypothetical protein
MEAPDFLDLETEVRDLFEKKLREFAAFCAENWTTSEAECQTLTVPSPCPAEYARGYNVALKDGISGAMDHWLDETGYGR